VLNPGHFGHVTTTCTGMHASPTGSSTSAMNIHTADTGVTGGSSSTAHASSPCPFLAARARQIQQHGTSAHRMPKYAARQVAVPPPLPRPECEFRLHTGKIRTPHTIILTYRHVHTPPWRVSSLIPHSPFVPLGYTYLFSENAGTTGSSRTDGSPEGSCAPCTNFALCMP